MEININDLPDEAKILVKGIITGFETEDFELVEELGEKLSELGYHVSEKSGKYIIKNL